MPLKGMVSPVFIVPMLGVAAAQSAAVLLSSEPFRK
jgi:hypothetical protein